MATHNEFGKKGEQIAAGFLEKNGYTILARNYRFQKAELDIIAIKEAVLAIVEVKSRTNTTVIDPKEAVNPKKIKRITAAANEYIIANDLDVEARFDIITIVKQAKGYEIEHIEDAFYHF